MARTRNWKKITILALIVGVLAFLFNYMTAKIPAQHATWIDWLGMLGFVVITGMGIWTILLAGGFGRKKDETPKSNIPTQLPPNQ